MAITGDVRSMLRTEHFRSTMREWGLDGVLVGLVGCCMEWESEGVPFLLEQRNKRQGPRSWALTIAGQTYHLRPVKTKHGYRMALNDHYHLGKGRTITMWATEKGVQHWFDVAKKRALAQAVNGSLREALGDAVEASTLVTA